jgi:hypothetical protein
MRVVFTTLLLVILILLAAAVAVFLLSLGFAGMGWLLSRILPLSLFEASIIAVLSSLGLAYVVGQIASARPTYEYDEDEGWEDEEDWDEEDWDDDWEEDEYEEPIPFPRWRERVGEDESADVPVVGRNDPCPCGSGKKYKYCHGKKK